MVVRVLVYNLVIVLVDELIGVFDSKNVKSLLEVM